ncbi:RNA polymerase sigma factor [Paenibacillus ginsengarvi]|uniref:RNA polymerase sigma factor n=1 Tax=Paenibacillus ginsengarvi TaxID=400777 RepID=A0A3B0BG52_9BACL|nr:RNA polymerase sigma factor [Paenibacillus ginsengarvi]RKN72375.1 RNA polymerase sigma factor [Paenibacillus ginsengarvi]
MNKNMEKLLIQCITEHKENVYRLAYSYVKNAEDALDIVQDAIQKAFTSASGLKSESTMKSWFYRIVINTSLDFLRKHKRVRPVDDVTLELHGPIVEDVYQNVDLEQAMEELPTAYRTVIVLRYFEDLKIEEMAEVLNENVNTVKTRLYQALNKLRVKMKDDSPQEVR